jgi:DNA-binding MarR family transcriptional regulator
LARDLGIALGIANATLKRCVEKGLIKVRQAPARRYAYYLTPSGFAEKSKLTGLYLTNSLRFFIHAQSECASLLQNCASRGWRKLVLAGSGELLEIVRLCARDQHIELIAVIDEQISARKVSGLSVVKTLDEIPVAAYDAVLVIDSVTPQSTVEAIRAAAATQKLSDERVLLLRLVPLRATARVGS